MSSHPATPAGPEEHRVPGGRHAEAGGGGRPRVPGLRRLRAGRGALAAGGVGRFYGTGLSIVIFLLWFNVFITARYCLSFDPFVKYFLLALAKNKHSLESGVGGV